MDPPYRDGSKCLVRDLCLHLTQVEPHVLSHRKSTSELGPRTVSHAVYGAGSSYRPAFWENARAASWLAAASRADIWHFVFAPNARSSQVARVLARLRRVRTVQTIASPPRSFENPRTLLFGDIVVAQSEWTKRQFQMKAKAASVVLPEIVEIPPPAPRVLVRSRKECESSRAALGLRPQGPLYVYPGDLEVSRGAARTIDWSKALKARVPDAQIAIAYRQKTENAELCAQALRASCDPGLVVFLRDVTDIHALIQSATAILFPVEDLYGKVDLPIVLLEALALGTPVLALDQGPLMSLRGALRIPLDPLAWIAQAARLAQDSEFRNSVSQAGLVQASTWYAPERVAACYEELYQRLLDTPLSTA